ncbi:hypothetical protein [Roseovarius confluentis]|uniref:hypothetical protein n=1 Tax=Roseovarius confluentis TaxID=1852027 RepID=UPI000CDD30E0|nr:hypothetical protein [Roseovarius confluentis]
MNKSASANTPFQDFEGFEPPDPDSKISKDDYALLLDLEKQQFKFCRELDRSNAEKTSVKSQAVREWWCIANAILWTYQRDNAHEGDRLDPMPMAVLSRLAKMADDLRHGNIPDFIKDVAVAGKGRPYWRMERRAIGYALLYIEAAARGEIEDGRPKSSVAKLYDVSGQTVRNWIQRRSEFVTGISKGQSTPQMLNSLIHEHGETFARIGRSTMKGVR